MNEGIHLDLDTWIVPGPIRKANLCRGLGNRYTPAGTEVLISAIAHNTPPPFQAAQNATAVNTRSYIYIIFSWPSILFTWPYTSRRSCVCVHGAL